MDREQGQQLLVAKEIELKGDVPPSHSAGKQSMSVTVCHSPCITGNS
jgi:hypothetical protein